MCAYALEQYGDEALSRGVVIGYDHRYNSETFAKLTAAPFLKKGFKVYLYRTKVHTPLVPFGITELNAVCGVMITASHNPKDDNGYKVYWSNGCQIIEPVDAGIANQIRLNEEPWAWDLDICNTSDLCVDPYDEMVEKYFNRISKLFPKADSEKAQPKYLYTPLHGVGGKYAKKAFADCGLNPFEVVEAQYEHDPDFPTVKFPNPEEKGALDLAMEEGSKIGAQIILANDPDADRFSAAERLPNGEWVQFNGNQLGTMIGFKTFEKYQGGNQKVGMLASAVSSGMLQAIGKVEGYDFEVTLTGFKWMGNQALKWEQRDSTMKAIFAYEEAIGFMCEDIVRDKDGISAMITFVNLANQLYQNGTTVYEYLMGLYHKYGCFVNENSYYICRDPELINTIFDKMRYSESGELNYPEELYGFKVTNIRDLTIGHDSSQPDNKPLLPVSASSQMITFELSGALEQGQPESNITLTLRTSGTEPKIKYYSELAAPTDPSLDISQVEQRFKQLQVKTTEVIQGITKALLKPEVYGLASA